MTDGPLTCTAGLYVALERPLILLSLRLVLGLALLVAAEEGFIDGVDKNRLAAGGVV